MLRRRFGAFFLTTIFIFVTAAPALQAWAQEDAPWVYFPETGHILRAPFLDFFKATGGLVRYGYPITEDFVDPKTRLLVQYFQKARVEWHPANPDPYKIQLGLLGDELDMRTAPIPVSEIPAASDPSCLYFSETGHKVCYKFLEYWRLAGGLDMFGYPISEFKTENGVIVQYFQRAKMEWQPSKPVGQQIQLTNLGEIYAKAAGVPGDVRAARPRPGFIIGLGQNPTNITSIIARGSILNAYIAPGANQSAYVMVVDQFSSPVMGAAVSLIVHYPAPKGDTTYQLSPTDKDGVTIQEFPAGAGVPGTMIPIEFIVTYPGLNPVHTPASYVIWYN